MEGGAVESFARTVQRVWQSGGARGFFAGFGARVIRRSLLPALAWPVFERTHKLLQRL